MGHKLVCFNCRKAFNRDVNNIPMLDNCQECEGKFVLYPHLFKPPRKDNIGAWKVVHFLYDNGFVYHHLREEDTGNYAKYPDNLIDAKDFVIKYRDQAIKIAK